MLMCSQDGILKLDNFQHDRTEQQARKPDSRGVEVKLVF